MNADATNTTKAGPNASDGKFVKVSGNRLTSMCGRGHEHNYIMSKDLKVTCDGKESALTDLKAGSTIRLTMCKDDKSKILAVESGKHIPPVTYA